MLGFKISLAVLVCFLSSVANANFNGTIPVVDMRDYYSGSKQANFINKFSHALQTVGFVAVINSKVDSQVLDDAYKAAAQFYAQDSSYKMRYNHPNLNGQRGYVQSEVAKGKTAKDFKEFYHLARDLPKHIQNKYNYPENIWPEDNNFKGAMQALMHELDQYSLIIAQALAQSLDEDPNFFVPMIQHGATLLRSIHYPANPPSDSLWAAAHTDIDLFTILPRATSAGLQIQNASGDWIDVIVPDNAFIINAGDMLQNITNGLYKSAAHRVVCKNKARERYSMVMFVHLRPNDSVAPLPKFVAMRQKQLFANVTSRELLFERLIDLGLHSDVLLKDFAKSGAMEKLIAVNRGSLRAMQALRDANLASPIVLKTLATQAL